MAKFSVSGFLLLPVAPEIGRTYWMATGGERVPERVKTTSGDGVDFGWVMQITFVATILVGAPLVAILSVPFDLPSWNARAAFAIRVGAVVWFVTAIAVYTYARRRAE
jgi:hypothetical protein